MRYAARVNGLTSLALTKLDVLDPLDEVRIATGYEIDGERRDDFPDDLARLERARPVLETLSKGREVSLWNLVSKAPHPVPDLV